MEKNFTPTTREWQSADCVSNDHSLPFFTSQPFFTGESTSDKAYSPLHSSFLASTSPSSKGEEKEKKRKQSQINGCGSNSYVPLSHNEPRKKLTDLTDIECQYLLFEYFLEMPVPTKGENIITVRSSGDEDTPLFTVKLTGADLCYVEDANDLKELGFSMIPTIRLRRIVSHLRKWMSDEDGYVPDEVTQFIRDRCPGDHTYNGETSETVAVSYCDSAEIPTVDNHANIQKECKRLRSISSFSANSNSHDYLDRQTYPAINLSASPTSFCDSTSIGCPLSQSLGSDLNDEDQDRDTTGMATLATAATALVAIRQAEPTIQTPSIMNWMHAPMSDSFDNGMDGDEESSSFPGICSLRSTSSNSSVSSAPDRSTSPKEDVLPSSIPSFARQAYSSVVISQQQDTSSHISPSQEPADGDIDTSKRRIRQVRSAYEALQQQPRSMDLLKKLCDALSKKVIPSHRTDKPPVVLTILPIADVSSILILLLTILSSYFPTLQENADSSHRLLLIYVLQVIKHLINRIECTVVSVDTAKGSVNTSAMVTMLPMVREDAVSLRHLLSCHFQDIDILKHLLPILLALMKIESWREAFMEPALSFGSSQHRHPLVHSLLTILSKYNHMVFVVKMVCILIKSITVSEDVQLLFLNFHLSSNFPSFAHSALSQPRTCCKLLHDLLDHHHQDVVVVKCISAVIWNLSATIYGRQCMVTAGIPALLAQVFAEHQYSEVSIQQLCGSISILSVDVDAAVVFGDNGVCERLVQLLQYVMKGSKTTLKALTSSNVNGTPSMTVIALHARALVVSKLLDQILGAIFALAGSPDGKNQKRLNGAGVCEILLQVLEVFSCGGTTCDCVVETVCGAIWAMMEKDEIEDKESRTLYTKTTNGCEVLQTALKKYVEVLESPSNTMLLSSSLSAMKELCGAMCCKVTKSVSSLQWYLVQTPTGSWLQLLQHALCGCLTITKSSSNAEEVRLSLLTIDLVTSNIKRATSVMLKCDPERNDGPVESEDFMLLLFSNAQDRKKFMETLVLVLSAMTQYVKNVLQNSSQEEREGCHLQTVLSIVHDVCLILDWLLVPVIASHSTVASDSFSTEVKQDLIVLLIDVATLFAANETVILSSLRIFGSILNSIGINIGLVVERSAVLGMAIAVLTVLPSTSYVTQSRESQQPRVLRLLGDYLINMIPLLSGDAIKDKVSRKREEVNQVITLLSLLRVFLMKSIMDVDIVICFCSAMSSLLNIFASTDISTVALNDPLSKLPDTRKKILDSLMEPSSASNQVLDLVDIIVQISMIHMHNGTIMAQVFQLLTPLTAHILMSFYGERGVHFSKLLLNIFETSLAAYGQDEKMLRSICVVLRTVLRVSLRSYNFNRTITTSAQANASRNAILGKETKQRLLQLLHESHYYFSIVPSSSSASKKLTSKISSSRQLTNPLSSQSNNICPDIITTMRLIEQIPIVSNVQSTLLGSRGIASNTSTTTSFPSDSPYFFPRHY